MLEVFSMLFVFGVKALCFVYWIINIKNTFSLDNKSQRQNKEFIHKKME